MKTQNRIMIPHNRLDLLFKAHGDEYENKALEILRSGQYVLGDEVAGFEKAFAEYNGTDRCVGVASGLDALSIALAALGIGAGDEVIVQGNTFIATFVAVSRVGATPVVADVTENFCADVNDIRKKITPKTRAVIVTQLFGLVAEMDEIVRVCREHGLMLLEDAAQAHGATYKDKKAGTFGEAGCFSFYPTKNLGGFGDGGAIITNNGEAAEKAKMLRNYGNRRRNETVCIGQNSRLDALQAGLLNVRLGYLDEINAEKRRIASLYSAHIKNPLVAVPKPIDGVVPVWHQYVIRCGKRDELKEFLLENGIETDIHYPIPPHLTKAYEFLGLSKGSLPVTEKLSKEILSLPMWFGLGDAETEYIIDTINKFA